MGIIPINCPWLMAMVAAMQSKEYYIQTKGRIN